MIFENINIQERLIENALVDWMKNKENTKQLCGYDWIIEGWNECL